MCVGFYWVGDLYWMLLFIYLWRVRIFSRFYIFDFVCFSFKVSFLKIIWKEKVKSKINILSLDKVCFFFVIVFLCFIIWFNFFLVCVCLLLFILFLFVGFLCLLFDVVIFVNLILLMIILVFFIVKWWLEFW